MTVEEAVERLNKKTKFFWTTMNPVVVLNEDNRAIETILAELEEKDKIISKLEFNLTAIDMERKEANRKLDEVQGVAAGLYKKVEELEQENAQLRKMCELGTEEEETLILEALSKEMDLDLMHKIHGSTDKQALLNKLDEDIKKLPEKAIKQKYLSHERGIVNGKLQYAEEIKDFIEKG